jgi:hypothetical protein
VAVAARFGDWVIDCAPATGPEGIHPTGAGYRRLGALIQRRTLWRLCSSRGRPRRADELRHRTSSPFRRDTARPIPSPRNNVQSRRAKFRGSGAASAPCAGAATGRDRADQYHREPCGRKPLSGHCMPAVAADVGRPACSGRSPRGSLQ